MNSAESVPVFDKTVVQGHHIIANFSVHETGKLQDPATFKRFVNLLIEEFRLSKIGEVYHSLENGGFTGVVCLTESHLSIHTWPERNHLTFDIFLSNYLRDNYATALALYQSVLTFFGGEIVFEQKIMH